VEVVLDRDTIHIAYNIPLVSIGIIYVEDVLENNG